MNHNTRQNFESNNSNYQYYVPPSPEQYFARCPFGYNRPPRPPPWHYQKDFMRFHSHYYDMNGANWSSGFDPSYSWYGTNFQYKFEPQWNNCTQWNPWNNNYPQWNSYTQYNNTEISNTRAAFTPQFPPPAQQSLTNSDNYVSNPASYQVAEDNVGTDSSSQNQNTSFPYVHTTTMPCNENQNVEPSSNENANYYVHGMDWNWRHQNHPYYTGRFPRRGRFMHYRSQRRGFNSTFRAPNRFPHFYNANPTSQNQLKFGVATNDSNRFGLGTEKHQKPEIPKTLAILANPPEEVVENNLNANKSTDTNLGDEIGDNCNEDRDNINENLDVLNYIDVELVEEINQLDTNAIENFEDEKNENCLQRHGRVQSVKLLSEDNSIPGSNISGGNGGIRKGKSATVAFIDIRTATKALRAVNSLDGQDLQITYHEPGSAPPRVNPSTEPQPTGDIAAVSDITVATLPQGNVGVGPGTPSSNGPTSNPVPGMYRQQRFPLQHGQSEDSSSHFYDQPKGFSRGRGDGHGFHGVRGRREHRHPYHNNRHSFPVDRNYRMPWNYPNEGRFAPPVHSEGDERSSGPPTPSHPPPNESGPKGPRRPDSPASSVSSRHLPSKRHKSRSVSESGSSDRGSSPGSRSRSGSRSSVSTSVSSGRSRSPPHHSSGHYSRGGSAGGRYHQNSYSRQRYSRSRVVSRPADSRVRHGSRSPMAASPSSSTSSSPSPHRKIAVTPHSPSHSPSSAKSYSPSRSINQSGHHHHHHHPRRTPTNAEYQAAIRIRNLPIRSSDTSLKDGLYHEYKKHGKVAWVRVTGSASERYAVVCFKSVEHATRAVALSQDKQFFGCKIHVTPYYNGRGDETAGGTDDDNRTLAEDEGSSVPTRTVLITGLDPSVTSSELKSAFDQYGDIVNIDIRKQGSSTQAICEFVDIASAIRAQWGRHVFKSRESRVSFCRNPATSSLLLDGTGGIHEKQVTSHCCQYGAILKVVMDPDRILALVQFEEISSAQTAIRELRNWVIKGKHLHVDFASPEVIRRFLERVTNGVGTGDTLSPMGHDPASSPINNCVGAMGSITNAFKETGGGIRRINRRITTGDEHKSAFNIYRHEVEIDGIKPITMLKNFEDSNSPESANPQLNPNRISGTGNLSGKVLSIESAGTGVNRNYRRHDSYTSPVSPDPDHSSGIDKVTKFDLDSKCNSKIDLSCHETDSAVVTSSSDVICVEKDETHNHHGSSSSSSMNGDDKLLSFDTVGVSRKSSVSSNKSNSIIVTVDGVSSTSPEPKTETVRKASPDPGIGVETTPRIINDTHIVTTGLIDPRKRSSESKIRRSSADSGNNVTVLNYHHGHVNPLQNSQGTTTAGSLYSSNLVHMHHPNQLLQSTAAVVSNNSNPIIGEDESDDRPGTPLCDENPESFSSAESTPASVRSPRTPGHSMPNKTDPLSLPLPEFARQRSTNNNITNMANMMKDPAQSAARPSRSSSELNIIKSPIKSPIGGSGTGVCVGASVMTSSASESEICSPSHVVDNNLSSFSSTTSTNLRDDPVDKNSGVVENPSLDLPSKGESASIILSSRRGSSSNVNGSDLSVVDRESKKDGVSVSENVEELKGGGTGSSSDSEGGSSPAGSPVGASLDERIKNLYEKYDQWNGNRSTVRATTVPSSSALATSSATCHESSSISLNKSLVTESALDSCTLIRRSRAVNLDEMLKQPSDIVKSLLAKRSVFDEDSKRLENFEDKYEAKGSLNWRVMALQRSSSTASTSSTTSTTSVPAQTPPPPLTPTTPSSSSTNPGSTFPTTPTSKLPTPIPTITPGNLANASLKPVHPPQSQTGNLVNSTIVKLKDLNPSPGSSNSGTPLWSKSESLSSNKGGVKGTTPSLTSTIPTTPNSSKSTNLPQTFPPLATNTSKSVDASKLTSSSSTTSTSSSSSSSSSTSTSTSSSSSVVLTCKTQDIQNHSSAPWSHAKLGAGVSNAATTPTATPVPTASSLHGPPSTPTTTPTNNLSGGVQSGIHHGIPRIVERSQSLDSRRCATGSIGANVVSASAGNSPNSSSNSVATTSGTGTPTTNTVTHSTPTPSRRISVDSHSSSSAHHQQKSSEGSSSNSELSSHKSKEIQSVTTRKLSESTESSANVTKDKSLHRVSESKNGKEKGIREKDLHIPSTAISSSTSTHGKELQSKKSDLNLIKEEASKVHSVHQETTVAVVATVQATLIPNRNEVVGSSSKDSKKEKEKDKKRRSSGSSATPVASHNNSNANNSNPSAHSSNVRSESTQSASSTKSSHSRKDRKEKDKDKETRNSSSSNVPSSSNVQGDNSSKHDDSNSVHGHHSHSSNHHHRKEKKEKDKDKEHLDSSTTATGSGMKESHKKEKDKDKESAKVKRRLSSQDSEQEHKKPKLEKDKPHESRESTGADIPHPPQIHHHHRIKSGSTSERRESRDSCSSLKDKSGKDSKSEKESSQSGKAERSAGSSGGDSGNTKETKEKEHHHRSKSSSSSSKHHHHGEKSRGANEAHSSSHSQKKSDSSTLTDKEKCKKDKEKEKVSPGKENSGKSSSLKHYGHGSNHHSSSSSKGKEGSSSSKSKSSSKEKDRGSKEKAQNCSVIESDGESENTNNSQSGRLASSSNCGHEKSRDRDKHDKEGSSKRDRHKSGGDSSSAPGGNDSVKSSSRGKSKEQKKRRRYVIDESESSESDDDDEEKQNKHHSIFEVVIDEYVSMYDKVKARSNRACKNNSTSKQQQEEQRKQDKLKEQFQQLKQSRAKREEKKRSTSIEERKSIVNTSSDEGSQIDLHHDSDAGEREQSKQDPEREKERTRDRHRERDRDNDNMAAVHTLSSDDDHIISHKGSTSKEKSKSRLKIKSKSKGKSSSSEKGSNKQKGGRRSNKSSPLGGTSFPPSSSSIFFSHSDDDSQASSPQLLPPVAKKRKLSMKHTSTTSSLTNVSLSVDTKSSDESLSDYDSSARKKMSSSQSTRSHGQSHSQKQKKLRTKEIYSDSDSSEANTSRVSAKPVVPVPAKVKTKEKSSRQKNMKKSLFESSESSDGEQVSTPAPAPVMKKEKELTKSSSSSKKDKDKENKVGSSTSSSRRKHHGHSSVSSSKSSKSSRKQRNSSGDVSCDIGGHSSISKRESGSTMEDFLFGPMTPSSSSDGEDKPSVLELERPKTPTINVNPINIFEETPVTSKKSKSGRSKQRKISLSHSFHSSVDEKTIDSSCKKSSVETLSSSSGKTGNTSEKKKKKHHREKRSKRNESQEGSTSTMSSSRHESKQIKNEPVDYDSLFNSPASSPVSVPVPIPVPTVSLVKLEKEIVVPPTLPTSSSSTSTTTSLFFGIEPTKVKLSPPHEKEVGKDPVLEECVAAIKQTGMFSTDEDDDDDDKLKIDINEAIMASSAEPETELDPIPQRLPTPEVIDEEAVKEQKRLEEEEKKLHSLFEQDKAIQSIVCLDRKSPPPPTSIPDDEVNKDEIPKDEAAISQEETEDAVAALLETLEGDDTEDVLAPSAPIEKPSVVAPSLQSPPTLRIIEEAPQIVEDAVANIPAPTPPTEPEPSPDAVHQEKAPDMTWSYDDNKSPKDLQIDEGDTDDKDVNPIKVLDNDVVELNNEGLPKTPDIELRKSSTESIHEEPSVEEKKKPGRRASSQKGSRQGSSETVGDDHGVVLAGDVYEFVDSDEEKKSKKAQLTHPSRHTPPITTIPPPVPVPTMKSPPTTAIPSVVTPAAVESGPTTHLSTPITTSSAVPPVSTLITTSAANQIAPVVAQKVVPVSTPAVPASTPVVSTSMPPILAPASVVPSPIAPIVASFTPASTTAASSIPTFSTPVVSTPTPTVSISIPAVPVTAPVVTISTPTVSITTSVSSVTTSTPAVSTSVPVVSAPTPAVSILNPVAPVSTSAATILTPLPPVSTPVIPFASRFTPVSTQLGSISSPKASVLSPMVSLSKMTSPAAGISAPTSTPTPIVTTASSIPVSAPVSVVHHPTAPIIPPIIPGLHASPIPKVPVVESQLVKLGLPTASPSFGMLSKPPTSVAPPIPTRSTLDDTIDEVVRNFKPFEEPEPAPSLPVVPMPKFSPLTPQVVMPMKGRTRSHSKDTLPEDMISNTSITKVIPKQECPSPRPSGTPTPVDITATITAIKPMSTSGDKIEKPPGKEGPSETETLIDPQTGILMPMMRQSEEGQYIPLTGQSQDPQMMKQHPQSHIMPHQVLQMSNPIRTAEIITKAMERPTVLEKLPMSQQSQQVPPPQGLRQVPIQKNEGLPAMLAQQQQQLQQQQQHLMQQHLQAQQIQQQHVQQQKQLQQQFQHQHHEQKQNLNQYMQNMQQQNQQAQAPKPSPVQQQTIVMQSSSPSAIHPASTKAAIIYTSSGPFHTGKPITVHTSITGQSSVATTNSTYVLSAQHVKSPMGPGSSPMQQQPPQQPGAMSMQRPVFASTSGPHPHQQQQVPYHMTLVRPQDAQQQMRPLLRQPGPHGAQQLGGPPPSPSHGPPVQAQLVRIPQIPSATTITKINTMEEQQQQRKATIIQSHSNVILTSTGGPTVPGGAIVRAVVSSPTTQIPMTHQQHQQHQAQTELFRRCAEGAPIARVQEAMGPSQPPRIDVGGSVVQTAAPSPKAGRVPQQHEQTPPQSTQQRIISHHQPISFDSTMDNPLDLATPSSLNLSQNSNKSNNNTNNSASTTPTHTNQIQSLASASPPTPYSLHGAQGEVRLLAQHVRQPPESSQYIPNQGGHQQMVYPPHFIPVTIAGPGGASLSSGQSSPFGLRVGSNDKGPQLSDGKSVMDHKGGAALPIVDRDRSPHVHPHHAIPPHLQSPHPSDQRGSESPMVTSVYAGPPRILYPTPVPSHHAPQAAPHHRQTFPNPYADLEERPYSQSPSYLPQYDSSRSAAAAAAAVAAAAAERDRERDLPPRVGSPYGGTRRGSSPPSAHNLRYSGHHPLPAAEAPSSNDRQRQTLVQTPPHASQVPPQGDSLLMLLQRYPIMWQGLLALKNDNAACQMHFVSGNMSVARDSLPSNPDGSMPPLRISQRMRLEQTQLEGVARKMQMEAEHCMLLALPCGRDHMDVLQQSNNLRHGFITYLQLKQAAGIVNIHHPISQQPAYVIHIFPSCDFANENLARIAPDLLHGVADIAHLLIVIATV